MQVPPGVGLSVAVGDSFLFTNEGEGGLSLLHGSDKTVFRMFLVRPQFAK